MKEISSLIQNGATTFLNREYVAILIFVIIFAFLIYFLLKSLPLVVAFIIGSIFSAIAGNIGMRVATKSNARVAWACSKDINKGMKIAFFSGSAISFLVVALSLIGTLTLFIVYKNIDILFGFGFGASSIALFARVAGGIYTKSADMGADLVGKIEKKLPEDDPRNPAVIADQVGDNVGDVAGMGADLFESYSDIIIAAIAIGSLSAVINNALLPFALASVGIISSFFVLFFIKGKNALINSIFLSSFFMIIFSFFLINSLYKDLSLFYCVVAGLIAGTVIGLTALYYTSYKFKPTKDIAKEAERGAALDIISGLSTGMFSTALPVIITVLAVLVSYYFSSVYGIAIAGVGMLSTLATVLATDFFGSISDNAAGISEMSGLGEKAKSRCSELDAQGNSTAALVKGFSIVSATLTAIVLFVIYTIKVGLKTIVITDPAVVSGLLLGALVPFLFSAISLKLVSSTATKVIDETRKQFRERISKNKEPFYNKVIAIATDHSIKGMIWPALLAIIFPIAIGLILGKAALGGFLASSIVTSFLLALTMANAGAAFDNAKKYVADVLKRKKTPQHEATVIGDTVGDPLKDCSGPSLNIFVKLMVIVTLVFFAIF